MRILLGQLLEEFGELAALLAVELPSTPAAAARPLPCLAAARLAYRQAPHACPIKRFSISLATRKYSATAASPASSTGLPV